MQTKQGFSDEILAIIHKEKIIGLRAGDGPHRIIGVWAVVVEKRVFIRSWSLKPNSWYYVFQKEPRGILQVAGQEFAIRVVRPRSERLKDAIDQAYLEKYKTPGSIQYARDMGQPKSRDTTTELVPI